MFLLLSYKFDYPANYFVLLIILHSFTKYIFFLYPITNEKQCRIYKHLYNHFR